MGYTNPFNRYRVNNTRASAAAFADRQRSAHTGYTNRSYRYRVDKRRAFAAASRANHSRGTFTLPRKPGIALAKDNSIPLVLHQICRFYEPAAAEMYDYALGNMAIFGSIMGCLLDVLSTIFLPK